MTAAADRAPETLAQARRFDKVKNYAIEAGLCHGCASQLAWGSAAGFSDVHPPCSACRRVVAGWPVLKPNDWRVPAGRLSDPDPWRFVRESSTTGSGAISGAGDALVVGDSSRVLARGRFEVVP